MLQGSGDPENLRLIAPSSNPTGEPSAAPTAFPAAAPINDARVLALAQRAPVVAIIDPAASQAGVGPGSAMPSLSIFRATLDNLRKLFNLP